MPLWLNGNTPLLHDTEIVNRIQKCLENADKSIEFGHIVRQLHAKYPEYRRRKQGPFRQLVKQALRIVNQDLKESNIAKETSVFVNEDANVPVNTSKTPNIMSSLLNNMYNKGNTQKPKNDRASADAISISSDESQENESDYLKSIEITSRSTINSRDVDVELSPSLISEILSVPQSINTGEKRAKQSPSDAIPAKKTMIHQQHNSDKMHNPDEYISDSSETIFSKIAEIADKIKKNQHKTKEKSVRTFKKAITLEKSVLNFKNLAGLDVLLKQLCQILIQIKKPEIYYKLGVVPPKGILIYGTSGCGKTCLAYAIAGQLNIPIINIPATELIAGVTGESEERIRDIFEQAVAAAPCVLFIDDVEAISANRINAQKEMERRIVSQLISCMDNLNKFPNGGNVLIIGATTRPDSLDSALRRAGRFDHEISIPIPNRKERQEILRLMCNGLQIEPDFNYDMIAELTPGYVGADISALVSRASLFAVKREFLKQVCILEEHPPKTNANSADCNENENENTNSSSSYRMSPVRPTNPIVINIDDELEEEHENVENEPVDDKANNIEPETISRDDWSPTLAQMIYWLNHPFDKMNFDNFFVSFEDFKAAIKVLQPSAKREGFLTVPDVSWDDIGSLRDIREELRLAILAPVKFSNEMVRLGLTSPSGVLLCGPPGCGKTLIAKAIANEAGINFLSVKGPELLNMYVGESERAVRDCFQRARNSTPCVIFFDEFDSLCPKRSDAHEGSTGIRVVNQLLTEMDGIEERKGVYIMAASNRPDIIDPAILRPGRLDTILYVGLPNKEDRIDILKAATKNRTSPVVSADVNFNELAEKTEGFSGADLCGMVRKAAMLSLKDVVNDQADIESVHVAVCMKHFTEALRLVRPSISAQDRKIYEKMREKYAAPRSAN